MQSTEQEMRPEESRSGDYLRENFYFEPKYEDFRLQTIWNLSNAFTSAFKEPEPIPQFEATAKLGEFLGARFSQSF